LGFFSPYIKVECRDGTRFILKEPEKAFSIIAPDWNVRIGAITKALKETEVNLEVKKKVKAIVEDLDKHYAELQAHYQAAYIQFSTNPCSKESNKALEKANEEIRTMEFKLREIELQTEKFLQSLASRPPTPPKLKRMKVLKAPMKMLKVPILMKDIEELDKRVSEFRHSAI
jgi:adenine-specific DNA methylase